jgi:hypothetical protein
MDWVQAQYLVQNVAPFAAYFLGIVIRKVALPGKDSPLLYKQLLLGIPLSLMVVSPLLGLLQVTDPKTFLVTTGLIIEHGMLVNERVTRLFASGQPDAPLAAGGGGP